MADYVSNTPVSRPVQVDWKMDWDIGGMAWSYQWGIFFKSSSQDDLLPFRLPAPITGQR